MVELAVAVLHHQDESGLYGDESMALSDSLVPANISAMNCTCHVHR